MRRFSSLLLLCVLILGCVQCGPSLGKDAEGKVIVNFWHGMGGPLGRVLEGMIDEYNGSQDKYFINGICMGSYDTLQKKILASVVAGRSPDISQNFEALTLKLSRAGKLVCLDDLIAGEPDPAGFKADIITVLLKNNTFDGKIWSFPFNKSVPVLYYNKDMFREVGLDPDKPPRTVKELEEYATILTRDLDKDGKPDVYGFALTLRNQWNWGCRFLSYGGNLFDPETRKVFLDSEAGIKATSSYSDMIEKGISKFAEGYDHQNEWLAEKVGMFEASIVSRVYLKEKIKFDHGVAPVPYGDTPAVILSGTNINIFDNKSPEKVEGAWDFIKWFTSTDNGARWSINSTYLPVRKSSLSSPVLIKALEEDPNFAAPYLQIDYATYDPRIPEWFECRVKISDELEQTYIKAAELADKGYSGQQSDIVSIHVKRMQETVSHILDNSLDADLTDK